MFKNRTIMVALVLALCFAGYVYAAERASTLGVPDSRGNYAVEVDTSNNVSFPAGAILAKYEAATTNATITAADSGTVFVVTPSSQTTFTLPTAAAGLTYKFVAARGHLDGNKKIVLDPGASDTLVGCVNSITTTTFAAGDSLISPGATGDSITLTAVGTLY